MASRDSSDCEVCEETRVTNRLDSCPECTGHLSLEGGETICAGCGLVVDEYRLDHGARPVTFEDSDEDRSRHGAPLTPARHDNGLSSEIGWDRDARGNSLPAGKRRRLGRLRAHHNRAKWQSKAERNLGMGLAEIARLVGALDLSWSIRSLSCTLFRRAQREGLFRGRSIEAMAAGSVFAACRISGCLRTLDEVAEAARCDRTAVQNAYRVLNIELGLEAAPTKPSEYLHRFCSEWQTSSRLRTRAGELVTLAEEHGLDNGRHPAGIAAACLYLAGRELGGGPTQGELASVANVTTATIRERYYELLDRREG